MDVADASSVGGGAAAAVEALGDVDVLVNNAGTDRFAFFVNTDEALWTSSSASTCGAWSR